MAGHHETDARLAAAGKLGPPDWTEIDALYAALERIQPSPVVTLNRAVAVSKVRGAAAALAMVEPLRPAARELLQLPRTARRLLVQSGRDDEAREAFAEAMARAATPAEAGHIRLQLDRLDARRK